MDKKTIIKLMDESLDRRRARKQQMLPQELFSLPVLAELNIHQTEQFFQLLDTTIQANLERCRSIFGLPAETDWIKAFKADLQKGDQELRSWSALYYTYCCRPAFGITKHQLAAEASTVPQVLRRWVLDGLNRLKIALEEQAATGQKQPPLQALEYSRLIGIKSILDKLLSLLKQPDGPRMIGLQGLGGIGKTALASEIVRQVQSLNLFPRVVWVSARQDRFDTHSGKIEKEKAAYTVEDVIAGIANGLGQSQLAGYPLQEKLNTLARLTREDENLIVVDNLETLEENLSLLPMLSQLTGKTRFLLTSRDDLSQFQYVQVQHIEALNMEDSVQLIQQEVERQNCKIHLTASELVNIFQLVGGVPLGLKLVAAQACYYPIGDILRNLKEAKEVAPKNLLTYIYRKTWLSLSEGARKFLVQTQRWIPPEGTTFDWLKTQVSLSEGELHQIITELSNQSLLETQRRDGLWMYSIHSLTRTFLRTDLLKNI